MLLLQPLQAGATFTALDPGAQSVRLTTTDGQSFQAQQVVLRTGASVALAHEAGLTTRCAIEPHIREAVVVDAQGRTSVPGVWAAGTAAGVSVHVIVTAGDGARP